VSKTNDGGTAFPQHVINPTAESYSAASNAGMTLRDWFAGQVLIGLSVRREGRTDAHDARNAYLLADAMLKAREAAP
jgi:hypothetical protein